jgi:hypothetical protein
MAYASLIPAMPPLPSPCLHSCHPQFMPSIVTPTGIERWKMNTRPCRTTRHGRWYRDRRLRGVNVISDKWFFKNKLNLDGTLEHRKACWVVHSFKQCQGIDFDQTFSPVVKPSTICTILHLDYSQSWHVNQVDVKNAFLHGELAERVYCLQPADFIDNAHPDHLCLLTKSLYIRPQAGPSRLVPTLLQ